VNILNEKMRKEIDKKLEERQFRIPQEEV